MPTQTHHMTCIYFARMLQKDKQMALSFADDTKWGIQKTNEETEQIQNINT